MGFILKRYYPGKFLRFCGVPRGRGLRGPLVWWGLEIIGVGGDGKNDSGDLYFSLWIFKRSWPHLAFLPVWPGMVEDDWKGGGNGILLVRLHLETLWALANCGWALEATLPLPVTATTINYHHHFAFSLSSFAWNGRRWLERRRECKLHLETLWALANFGSLSPQHHPNL